MQSTAIPKWALQKYAVLWNTFKAEEFDYQQAEKVLKEESKTMMSLLFSNLRKSGWLEIKLHPSDMRKRVYSLHAPEEMIKKIAESTDSSTDKIKHKTKKLD